MLTISVTRSLRHRSASRSVYICRRHASHLASRTNLPALDAKWQPQWAQRAKPVRDGSKPKSYVLPMFAYPSGSLHMGHLRVYTISDVLARYRRLKGNDVLHPTGWDAFGLPAENAAIERGIDPGEWTLANIVKMKEQLKSMNTDFDWDAEISTCSPDFYKHTQKLFLMLYERGLAYQAEALVNWDPVDKTVLANEQVDSNGRSWRSGAVVEQKMLRQWFFKITDFREELLGDLHSLSKNKNWPERVLTQQRNWIGRSQGARIAFDLDIETESGRSVTVFTTRADTLFGVKYLALSLSHPVVRHLASFTPRLEAFLHRQATFAPDSKDGFKLPLTAINPASKLGHVDTPSIPVFAAPYVLDGYGEGAVMGVPGHDARDLAFYKQHFVEERVPLVVSPPDVVSKVDIDDLKPRTVDFREAYTDHGVLTQLCGPYAGLDTRAGANRIIQHLKKQGLAESASNWRLRDWLVSRQRYWGTPIPMVHCSDCGIIPVPETDLPVQLPKLDSSFQGKTGNPLTQCADWVNTTCPSCGGDAKRETDTMDTFVDSSWYYMRFADPKNKKEMFSSKSAAATLPVDTYVGGVEHAILHLLYARFIYKFLCKEGLVKTESTNREPFAQLIAQGMVHGKTFSDPETGRFLLPHEIDHSGVDAVIKNTGVKANVSWEKMSKSKHNGVDPAKCIAEYGADATRAHILFAAPVSEVLQWDEEKIIGIQRWFQRVSRLVTDVLEIESAATSMTSTGIKDTDAEILLLTQQTIRQVTSTLESNIYGLNTYISDLIKMTNAIFDKGVPTLSPAVAVQCTSALIQMLAPVAPAFAEQCWEEIQQKHNQTLHGSKKSVFESRWPKQVITQHQESELKSRAKTQVCAVQINGKLKFTANVPRPDKKDPDGSRSKKHEQAVIDAVLATEEGKLWLLERNDWEKKRRVVVVGGGKLLNVVF